MKRKIALKKIIILIDSVFLFYVVLFGFIIQNRPYPERYDVFFKEQKYLKAKLENILSIFLIKRKVNKKNGKLFEI